MITATTITATTITVMRPRQFVITVTMRIPRTHAPPMDTGDQISSLTVYSLAPARGSPVGTDKAITAAVVMADTAADVAVTAAVAGDTAVAVILQEDVADTPGDMVGMLAVDIVGTVAVPDSVAVAVSTALASARTAVVMVTAVMVTAVVITGVAVTAVMVTAVADTKSAIFSRLGERLPKASLSLLCGVKNGARNSLVPQSHEGIYTHGASRRDVAGYHSNQNRKRGNRD